LTVECISPSLSLRVARRSVVSVEGSSTFSLQFNKREVGNEEGIR